MTLAEAKSKTFNLLRMRIDRAMAKDHLLQSMLAKGYTILKVSNVIQDGWSRMPDKKGRRFLSCRKYVSVTVEPRNATSFYVQWAFPVRVWL